MGTRRVSDHLDFKYESPLCDKSQMELNRIKIVNYFKGTLISSSSIPLVSGLK